MAISLVFLLTVFVAGLLSFFSPCIFPLLPVYLGILLGQDREAYRYLVWQKDKLVWAG